MKVTEPSPGNAGVDGAFPDSFRPEIGDFPSAAAFPHVQSKFVILSEAEFS